MKGRCGDRYTPRELDVEIKEAGDVTGRLSIPVEILAGCCNWILALQEIKHVLGNDGSSVQRTWGRELPVESFT